MLLFLLFFVTFSLSFIDLFILSSLSFSFRFISISILWLREREKEELISLSDQRLGDHFDGSHRGVMKRMSFSLFRTTPSAITGFCHDFPCLWINDDSADSFLSFTSFSAWGSRGEKRRRKR